MPWPGIGTLDLDENLLDPRATPPMYQDIGPDLEEPVQETVEFFAVEEQEARPCYLCARLCQERAEFRLYTVAMHQYCARVLGEINVKDDGRGYLSRRR